MFKLPDKSFRVLQKFLLEHRPLVFKYMVKKIKAAILADENQVELFEFSTPTHKHIAMVKSADFEKILEQAIEASVEVEDYETAKKARNTISLYRNKQIIKLLNDIKDEE